MLFRRLRDKHGWSEAFLSVAVREYRRFLYLAAVSDSQISPSPVVDQVWHEHLCFTRSYWEELCRDTLHKPLHHEPDEDRARNRARFGRLHQLYRVEFGHAPPVEVWAPRSRLRTLGVGRIAIAGLTAAGVGAAACDADRELAGFGAVGALVGIVWIVSKLFGGGRGHRRGGRGEGVGGDSSCGSSCGS